MRLSHLRPETVRAGHGGPGHGVQEDSAPLGYRFRYRMLPYRKRLATFKSRAASGATMHQGDRPNLRIAARGKAEPPSYRIANPPPRRHDSSTGRQTNSSGKSASFCMANWRFAGATLR